MTTFDSSCPAESAQAVAFPTVDRVSCQSLTARQFAERYQRRGIPVVITNLLAADPGWDLDYLAQQLGNQKFLLRYYGRDRYDQDKRDWTSVGSGVQTQSQRFCDYAQIIRSGEAHQQDIYLGKCSLQATPLAQSDAAQTLSHQLKNLGLEQPASSLNLWIGSGHTECLHYDVMDGTLIQLHGSKQIVLFPPSQTANLYPYPVYAHLRHGLKLRSWFSQVYPNRPDFQAFPRLQIASQHRHDVTLHPGELLYIPAGWWHEVTAIGEDMVCSVNRFWHVYPTLRAWFLWNRWRVYFGTLCAMPKTLMQLVLALFSRDRQQKLKEIRQML